MYVFRVRFFNLLLIQPTKLYSFYYRYNVANAIVARLLIQPACYIYLPSTNQEFSFQFEIIFNGTGQQTALVQTHTHTDTACKAVVKTLTVILQHSDDHAFSCRCYSCSYSSVKAFVIPLTNQPVSVLVSVPEQEHDHKNQNYK